MKDKVRLSNGYREKYFAPQEIVLAMRVAAEATRRAEQQKLAHAGDSSSMNQP